jgi:hypothetical protein
LKIVWYKDIPHGIKYCLTLHDKDNRRILGYDNAHDCLPKLRKYRTKKEKWDHVHKKNHGYEHQRKLHGTISSALRGCSQ